MGSLFFCLIHMVMATDCARILVVLPSPAYSHNVVHRTIYKELSLKGHEVVAFTPNPLKDPRLTNLTEIDMSFIYKRIKNIKFEEFLNLNKIAVDATVQNVLLEISRDYFMHPDMKRMLNDSQERFDLFIVEWNINPSYSVLSKRFNCPMVGIRSLGLRLEGYDSVGSPTNPSYIPVAYMDFNKSFWGRLNNFLTSFIWRLRYHWVTVPNAQKIADEFFPTYSKNLLDTERNVSIVLTNTRPILNGVRPLVPAIVEIGGVHLRKEKQTIPEDIQHFLDKSPEGVVYFSWGSLIKMPDFKPNKLLLSALSELPFKVLWKWDKEVVSGLPSNVKISKWLPQEAILGHPNVKLFITHGGLLSLLESVDNHVPLVAIPLYVDQHVNARRIEELQIGKRLNILNLNKKDFLHAVKDVIQNPIYKENIKKVAVILKDVPMKPLDKAIWWIEYVLKHKGSHHLKSAAIKMDWFTYLLMDVVAFLIIAFTVILIIFYYIIKYACFIALHKFYKTKTE